MTRAGPESLVFSRADWMAEALCGGLNTNTFFPDREDFLSVAVTAMRVRNFCAGCPVRAECLDYAVTNNIQHGWWGGLSPKERRVVRRKACAS